MTNRLFRGDLVVCYRLFQFSKFLILTRNIKKFIYQFISKPTIY